MSDRDRIQTCNRLIRSQLLYSVELRGQRSQLLYSVELRGHLFLFNGCKGMGNFFIVQMLQ